MKLKVIILAPLLLFLVSCKEKNKSIYEGCCGTEPVTDSVPMTIKLWNDHGMLVDSFVHATLYIPNIFIPDSSFWDNSNFLICGQFIEKIVSARYYSESGGLLSEQTNFLPCDTGRNWHGEKPDGSLYYGVFDYEISVLFVNGATKTYQGRACAYKCSEEGFPSSNLPNCIFPNQHNGNGGVDPSLPKPDECF